jgi:hypothetical protein
MAEFRDLRSEATAESAALAFAQLWSSPLEWVRHPILFRLGRTLFRLRARGLAWEVVEDKRIPVLAWPGRAA